MDFCHLPAGVYDRFRVRHGTDCSDAALRGSFPPGLKRFLILKPRIAQMHVKVDKTRHYITSAGINHFLCIRPYLFLHFLNAPVRHQHIINSVPPCQGICHMSVFYQNTHKQPTSLSSILLQPSQAGCLPPDAFHRTHTALLHPALSLFR